MGCMEKVKKKKKWGKFHHGHEKALTVNSVIHQGRVIVLVSGK